MISSEFSCRMVYRRCRMITQGPLQKRNFVILLIVSACCIGYFYVKKGRHPRELPSGYIAKPLKSSPVIKKVTKTLEDEVLILNETVHHECERLKFAKYYIYTVLFSGGLGNHMFQYAFLYSTSKKYRAKMVMPPSKRLADAFNLKPDTNALQRRQISQGCFRRVMDKYDCAYDASLFENVKQDMEFVGYFQSWKYFIKYANELRAKFEFTPQIQKEARQMIEVVLKKYDKGDKDTRPLIVGVHVRRGDKIFDRSQKKFGHMTPDENYILRAMQYFRDRYEGVIFIFASDDRLWTQRMMVGQDDVHIIGGKSAEADMAALSMTDHSIITVGTFGWWIAFLANGTTIYYRYPYRQRSPFEREFNGNTKDFFLPGWIGMD